MRRGRKRTHAESRSELAQRVQCSLPRIRRHADQDEPQHQQPLPYLASVTREEYSLVRHPLHQPRVPRDVVVRPQQARFKLGMDDARKSVRAGPVFLIGRREEEPFSPMRRSKRRHGRGGSASSAGKSWASEKNEQTHLLTGLPGTLGPELLTLFVPAPPAAAFPPPPSRAVVLVRGETESPVSFVLITRRLLLLWLCDVMPIE